jgi:hypothetical protein
MPTKRVLRSPQGRKKEAKRRSARKVLTLLTLVAIIFGFSELSKNESFVVQEVTFSERTVTSSQSMEASIWKALEGNYFWLFSKRNGLLIDEKEIGQQLKEEFPRLEVSSVDVRDWQELYVDIKEREPVALYCGLEYVEGQKCFFLDDTAFIFSPAPTFSDNVYTMYYGPLLSGDGVGGQYISSEKFQEYEDFGNVLRDAGLEPIRFSLNDEHHAEVLLAQGGRILTSLDDIALSGIDLKLFIQTEFGDSLQEILWQLDYIDARFDNRLFYKFKEESGV